MAAPAQQATASQERIDDKATFDHVDQVEAGNEKALTWDQVRVEAERDEEWQHSLTLFQSLKVYRHVRLATLRMILG